MRRVFLSDVHLSPREPLRAERLVRFLEREAGRIDELYILGDLFDYWIGPKHIDLPDYREVLQALRRATAGGLRITFIIGNRDFYMSHGLPEATGVRVADGRTAERLTLGSAQVHLCHGDYLEGRRDLGFRIQEWIRSPGFERQFIRLPTFAAKAMAEFYRWLSGRKTRRAVRLSEEALLAEFRGGTDILICGHVHEACEERRRVDGREKTLYVLGDWSDGATYLVEEDGRWELRRE